MSHLEWECTVWQFPVSKYRIVLLPQQATLLWHTHNLSSWKYSLHTQLTTNDDDYAKTFFGFLKSCQKCDGHKGDTKQRENLFFKKLQPFKWFLISRKTGWERERGGEKERGLLITLVSYSIYLIHRHIIIYWLLMLLLVHNIVIIC